MLDECIAQAQQLQKNRNSNQMSLFDFVDAPSLNTVNVEIPDIGEFDKGRAPALRKGNAWHLRQRPSAGQLQRSAPAHRQLSISEISEQNVGVTLGPVQGS